MARGRPTRLNNTCCRGHVLTPENTRIRDGQKHCVACDRLHWRNYYYRKRYGLKQAPPQRRDASGAKSMKDTTA